MYNKLFRKQTKTKQLKTKHYDNSIYKQRNSTRI